MFTLSLPLPFLWPSSACVPAVAPMMPSGALSDTLSVGEQPHLLCSWKIPFPWDIADGTWAPPVVWDRRRENMGHTVGFEPNRKGWGEPCVGAGTDVGSITGTGAVLEVMPSRSALGLPAAVRWEWAGTESVLLLCQLLVSSILLQQHGPGLHCTSLLLQLTLGCLAFSPPCSENSFVSFAFSGFLCSWFAQSPPSLFVMGLPDLPQLARRDLWILPGLVLLCTSRRLRAVPSECRASP